MRKCTIALDDVGWQRNNSGAASVDQVRQRKAWSCKFDSDSQGNFDKGKACNYCHEAGHWKAKCLVLQAKNKGLKLNVSVCYFH